MCVLFVCLNPSCPILSANPGANTAALYIIYPHSSTTTLTAATTAEKPAQKVHALQLKTPFFHKRSSFLLPLCEPRRWKGIPSLPSANPQAPSQIWFLPRNAREIFSSWILICRTIASQHNKRLVQKSNNLETRRHILRTGKSVALNVSIYSSMILCPCPNLPAKQKGMSKRNLLLSAYSVMVKTQEEGKYNVNQQKWVFSTQHTAPDEQAFQEAICNIQ